MFYESIGGVPGEVPCFMSQLGASRGRGPMFYESIGGVPGQVPCFMSQLGASQGRSHVL